jgi:hypothetical protein
LFNVPTGLIRILDRDLTAAGIPKISVTIADSVTFPPDSAMYS